MNFKVMPGEEQNDEGKQGHDGQDRIIVAEQTPGRAGVAPVDQLEEAWNDHLLFFEAHIAKHDELR
jgi:hypothetical protein